MAIDFNRNGNTSNNHAPTPPAQPKYDKAEQFEKIRESLLPNEKIFVVYDAAGAGTGFIGITDCRVILQDNSFVGGKVALTSIPFKEINSVSYVSNKSVFGKFAEVSNLGIQISSKMIEVTFRGADKTREVHDLILQNVLAAK